MHSQDTENITACQATRKTRKAAMARRAGRLRSKGRGKGNFTRGTERYNTTLTDDDVRAIRRKYGKSKNGKKSSHTLAREYKLTAQAIMDIVNRKSWAHVA